MNVIIVCIKMFVIKIYCSVCSMGNVAYYKWSIFQVLIIWKQCVPSANLYLILKTKIKCSWTFFLYFFHMWFLFQLCSHTYCYLTLHVKQSFHNLQWIQEALVTDHKDHLHNLQGAIQFSYVFSSLWWLFLSHHSFVNIYHGWD